MDYARSLFGGDVSGAYCASRLLNGVLMPEFSYIYPGQVDQMVISTQMEWQFMYKF